MSALHTTIIEDSEAGFDPAAILVAPDGAGVGAFAAVYDLGSGDFLVGLAAPEEQEPRFICTAAADYPELEYEGMHARVVMGNLWGKAASVSTSSDVLYLDVRFEAGGTLELPEEYEDRAVFVLDGGVEIAGRSYDPSAGIVRFKVGEQVVVKGLSPTRMLVLGGESVDAAVHIAWHFISPDQTRIARAREDWKARLDNTCRHVNDFPSIFV
ncbi:MAG: pirin-like C-terminal cupin domain-containing protein [Alphaproteobacteria bacterium]